MAVNSTAQPQEIAKAKNRGEATMILHGTVQHYNDEGKVRDFKLETNCYWVTITREHRKGVVQEVFKREAMPGSKWLDKKHRAIADALDALERAIHDAIDAGDE